MCDMRVQPVRLTSSDWSELDSVSSAVPSSLADVPTCGAMRELYRHVKSESTLGKRFSVLLESCRWTVAVSSYDLKHSILRQPIFDALCVKRQPARRTEVSRDPLRSSASGQKERRGPAHPTPFLPWLQIPTSTHIGMTVACAQRISLPRP